MKKDEVKDLSKAIVQVINWTDCLHRWSNTAVKAFQNQVYGGNESEGYLDEKYRTLKALGVMYWLGKLDKPNFLRFMRIILTISPEQWVIENITEEKDGHNN